MFLLPKEGGLQGALLLGDREMEGSYGEQAIIKYYDLRCTARGEMNLPESGSYTVEVIDTWEMTRTVVQSGASERVTVDLPGKEGMALLAVRV